VTEPTIFDLVRADLEERDRVGWEQHHRPLLANDGRDSLREAYEEALDLVVYLRKLWRTRDAMNLFSIGERVALKSCADFPERYRVWRGKVEVLFDDFRNDAPKAFRPDSLQFSGTLWPSKK